MEAMSWCLDNNIKVYVEPIGKGKNPDVRIIIDKKGKIIKGKKTYRQDRNVSRVIYDLYLHLYDKFH